MNAKYQTERLAQALLLPINPALVVLLGIYTLVWGAWIASPLWTVFDRSPIYADMAEIAPEYVWGGIAIVAGLVITYGAVKRSYKALTRGAGTAFIHWIVITGLYFMGDPLDTGGISALVVALYAAAVYLNIRVNFRPNYSPNSKKMVHK